MLLKIPQITKRDLKINSNKSLLDLFHFRSTVNPKFIFCVSLSLMLKLARSISLFSQFSMPFTFKPSSHSNGY